MDEQQALDLLKKHATNNADYDGVSRHSLAVSKLATIFAQKLLAKGQTIDLSFVTLASILHDIGRFKIGPGKNSGAHGFEGGQILKSEGLNQKFISVCETHSGISQEDITAFKVPIPKADYLPYSIEEKVIYFADKLFKGDKRISVEEAAKRFESELGIQQKNRFLKINDWLVSIIGKID